MRQVLSLEPEMMVSPWQLNWQENIQSLWPSRDCSSSPDSESHSLSVRSPLAVRILVPCGLKSTLLISALCPFSVVQQDFMCRLYSLTVPSTEAVASLVPVELQLMSRISSVWPRRVSTHFPVPTSQILQVLSMEPVAQYSPVNSNSVADSSAWCPLRMWIISPIRVSQIIAVMSKDPVTILSPSALNFRDTISFLWPRRQEVSFPVYTSHSLAVLSSDPVATMQFCGSKLTHTIYDWCPTQVWQRAPVLASQILRVLSKEPVATRSPKGTLKAMQQTAFLWPSRECSSSPDSVSQILQVRSQLPVMNLSPFLLKAQLVRGSMCPLRVLKRVNSCSFFSQILMMSSGEGGTVDEGLELGLATLGYHGLLLHYLLDQLVDVGGRTQVQQVDRFGLDLPVAPQVLKDHSGRVVPQQELFQLHLILYPAIHSAISRSWCSRCWLCSLSSTSPSPSPSSYPSSSPSSSILSGCSRTYSQESETISSEVQFRAHLLRKIDPNTSISAIAQSCTTATELKISKQLQLSPHIWLSTARACACSTVQLNPANTPLLLSSTLGTKVQMQLLRLARSMLKVLTAMRQSLVQPTAPVLEACMAVVSVWMLCCLTLSKFMLSCLRQKEYLQLTPQRVLRSDAIEPEQLNLTHWFTSLANCWVNPKQPLGQPGLAREEQFMLTGVEPVGQPMFGVTLQLAPELGTHQSRFMSSLHWLFGKACVLRSLRNLMARGFVKSRIDALYTPCNTEQTLACSERSMVALRPALFLKIVQFCEQSVSVRTCVMVLLKLLPSESRKLPPAMQAPSSVLYFSIMKTVRRVLAKAVALLRVLFWSLQMVQREGVARPRMKVTPAWNINPAKKRLMMKEPQSLQQGISKTMSPTELSRKAMVSSSPRMQQMRRSIMAMSQLRGSKYWPTCRTRSSKQLFISPIVATVLWMTLFIWSLFEFRKRMACLTAALTAAICLLTPFMYELILLRIVPSLPNGPRKVSLKLEATAKEVVVASLQKASLQVGLAQLIKLLSIDLVKLMQAWSQASMSGTKLMLRLLSTGSRLDSALSLLLPITSPEKYDILSLVILPNTTLLNSQFTLQLETATDCTDPTMLLIMSSTQTMIVAPASPVGSRLQQRSQSLTKESVLHFFGGKIFSQRQRHVMKGMKNIMKATTTTM